MAGCNSCKGNSKSVNEILADQGSTKKSFGETLVKYTFKMMTFLLFLVVLPLINLYLIWLIFEMLILNKNIDIKPLLFFIGNKFKKKDDDEEEEYLEDLDESEVVLMDVEDITNKASN